MDGRLFTYWPDRSLIAFQSGPVDSDRAVVFIAGLTEGLLATPYVPALGAQLAEAGWSLVQVTLSSSYSGYGTSSLDRDVEELDRLVGFLTAGPAGSPPLNSIVLCGHSTGAQDAVHYMRRGQHRASIRGIVLQAPVSDREFYATQPEYGGLLAESRALIAAGKPHALLERHDGDVPITAYRQHSLLARLGDDDYFSSDFTDAELMARLGHLRLPVLFAVSGRDQYVPATVDIRALTRRWQTVVPGSEVLLLEQANHNLSEPAGESDRFAAAVRTFVSKLS